MSALLVTPASVDEVFAAKAVFGATLALLTGYVTLGLNHAFGSQPWAMAVSLLVAGVMLAEFGLMLGAWAKDSNTLFTAWKSGALLVVFPVIFFIFPDLPGWIPKLGPTYWFLDPIFSMAVLGTPFGEVAWKIGVAFLVCLAFIPLVRRSARKMERRIAT